MRAVAGKEYVLSCSVRGRGRGVSPEPRRRPMQRAFQLYFSSWLSFFRLLARSHSPKPTRTHSPKPTSTHSPKSARTHRPDALEPHTPTPTRSTTPPLPPARGGHAPRSMTESPSSSRYANSALSSSSRIARSHAVSIAPNCSRRRGRAARTTVTLEPCRAGNPSYVTTHCHPSSLKKIPRAGRAARRRPRRSRRARRPRRCAARGRASSGAIIVSVTPQ